MTAIAERTGHEITHIPATVEKVLIDGDLSGLSPNDRISYYNAVCTSLGLNPLTKPFEFLKLSGKLTLYARRDCTDQLRKINQISTKILSRKTEDGIHVVVAQATDSNGRCEESTGAVCVEGLRGEALANAIMKTETKAKRRVTLSICGLGFADESEVESTPGAHRVTVGEPLRLADPQEFTVEKLSADKVAFKAAFGRTGVKWDDFVREFNDSNDTGYAPSDLKWDSIDGAQRRWCSEWVINELKSKQQTNGSAD